MMQEYLNESVLNITLLLILWICVWAGAFYILIPQGVNYLERSWIFALYFLGAAAIGYLLFQSEIQTVLTMDALPIFPFALLAAVVIIIVGTYRTTKKHIPKPAEAEFIPNGPNPYFLTLDNRYIVSKSCEILFQQFVIAVLVILLLRSGLSLWQTMATFAVLFGVVHLPLLRTGNRFWGWYFTLFAIGSSVVFPPLISKVPYGFVYTYIIHWMFYTVSGVFFWVWYGKRKKV